MKKVHRRENPGYAYAFNVCVFDRVNAGLSELRLLGLCRVWGGCGIEYRPSCV